MMSNTSIAHHCRDWKRTYYSDPVHEAFWSYIFTFVATAFFSIPSTLLNALVVIAIYKTKALHTSSNILLCSLAIADFLVGILAQPIYLIHVAMEIKGYLRPYCVTGATTAFVSYTSAGASLFTLAAISIDRCFAIHRPLKYRALVTTKVLARVALLPWLLGAIGASTRLIFSMTSFMYSVAIAMLSSLLIILVANLKAFRSLRIQKARLMRRLQLHQGQEQVKLSRNRKFLVTMLYILGLVWLCYVPFISVSVVTALQGVNKNTRAAWNFADTIGYMNSSLNPFLYCMRMREISNTIRIMVRKHCCGINNDVVPINRSFKNIGISLE